MIKPIIYILFRHNKPGDRKNCFIAGAIRFVPVTEDEEPQFLLACEYRSFIR